MGSTSESRKTLALVFDETHAWLRVAGDSYALTKEEVRELSKVFRGCVEFWDRKEPGK